uniref:Uncharacterized protein n=1 Tax=Timema bartmani TaxID=61472 RepID=A0A7R9F9R5_9NEOP|nr:unnamed protein product [Timema bartmani]
MLAGGQGHWRKYMTLPNILKEYNPKLLGYALGTAETSSPLSGLNVAENGALDDELLKQAKSLVRKIRQDHFIDIDNDWKLVNILIGGNDICNEYCFVDGAKDTPSGHRKNLEVALDYLQTHLPRTFVNLIHIPNVILLRNMKNVPFVCYMKQLVLCSCLFGAGERAKAESVSKILQEYWQVEKIVSELEKYDTDTFTVVLQPFFLGVEAPRSIPTLFGEAPDLSYFAPDCFHFSQKGNSLGEENIPIYRRYDRGGEGNIPTCRRYDRQGKENISTCHRYDRQGEENIPTCSLYYRRAEENIPPCHRYDNRGE